MQTIINPYTDIVQTAGDTMPTKDLQYAIMQANVFQQGVQAAQQEPIVVQKPLKDIAKPFQRMIGCWCLGYRVEIETQEHLFKLRIMQGQKLAYQKDYTDLESLKVFGATFLSNTVSTELGHPVKFVL